MFKLKDFLLRNEDFKNKNLLFITFNRDKLEKIIINNNDGELTNIHIFKFFKNFINRNLKNTIIKNNNQKKYKVFDYVFIDLNGKNLKETNIKIILKDVYEYMKSGTRIFISKKNNQNIKNFFSFRKINKKENLNVSKNLLLYDYIYFSNINFNIDKRLKALAPIITKFLSIISNIIYIKFYFCAKNILIKYIYVPEFIKKN